MHARGSNVIEEGRWKKVEVVNDVLALQLWSG
jgi:hypothetical protein